MSRFRFSAILPFVFSTVAFALLIVLATAGTKPGAGSQFYLLSVNTSKIGTETIKFETVSNSLPGVNDPTGILNGLISGLQGLVGSVGDAVKGGLQDVESGIIRNITEAVGVQDVYNIYMQNICAGELTNAANPNSLSISTCPSFKDASQKISDVSSQIPSSVVIGTTKVTVPLLQAVTTTLGSLQDIIDAGTKANFAFLLIGLISSGIVMLLSIVAIFLARVRILILANLFFASLAPTSLLISAVFTTVIIKLIAAVVNGIGPALTINAKGGNDAITVAWIAWALSVVSFMYWFLVWFVEFRKTAFVRNNRGDDEIGNYKGIVGETIRHLRRPAGKEQ